MIIPEGTPQLFCWVMKLYLLRDALQRVECMCYKYLDLFISSTMSWSMHIT